MKKFTILVTVALFFLTACANKEQNSIKLDPKEPINITLWNYYSGPQQTAFNSLVEEFNRTDGAKKGVNIEAYSYGGVNDLVDSVMASANSEIASKPMPNIFASYSDVAYELDTMGKLADIGKHMTKEETDLYIQTYIEEGYLSGEGQLKIFPVAKSSEVGMLNKTDFDIFMGATEGVTYQDLKTFEGIAKVSEKYYNYIDAQTPNIPNDGKAFFGIDSIPNFMNVVSHQLGKDLFKISDGKATINYDKETLAAIWDIYYKNMVKGYFASNSRFRSDDAKTGDILYMIGATTGLAYFPEQVTDINGNSHNVEFLAVEMPTLSTEKKVVVQQGAGMCVSKSDDKTEYAAALFLKWLTTPERNVEFTANSSGYMPVMKSAMEDEKMSKEIMKLIESEENQTKINTYKRTIQVLEKYNEQYRSYTFFYLKPFENSYEIRGLQESFAKYCIEAHQKARAEIDAGADYATVISKYCAESEFEKWYSSFDSEVKKLIG